MQDRDSRDETKKDETNLAEWQEEKKDEQVVGQEQRRLNVE